MGVQFEGTPKLLIVNTLAGAWAMGVLTGNELLEMSLIPVAGGAEVCKMQKKIIWKWLGMKIGGGALKSGFCLSYLHS